MKEVLTTEVLISIVVAIFLIFIYTLFFFNWSRDIKFWSKQKSIHQILSKYKNKTKSKNNTKLNNAYNEIKNLFKDKKGDFHLNKMYNILTIMSKQNDKGDKYLIDDLLSKIQAEQKYFAVSKNFQILFKNIDTQLISVSIDKEQLQTNITLIYNKIGEVEREANFSKKGYWVGLLGLVITIISLAYSIIK